MVLIDLFANSLYPSVEDEWPYIAKVLLYGKEKTFGIRDRAHLVKRFTELNKTEACPSQEEIDVMIANFPNIFS